MNILFRADANSTIGSGHIMRTLSIAAAFREQGADCLFVSADGATQELVANAGFRQIALNTDWRNMPEELPAMLRILDDEDPAWMIVDSYYVSYDYLHTLRQKVCLAYIDDVDSFVYPVNCLINYNVFAHDTGYEARYPSSTLQLLGTSYVPLRNEFFNISPRTVHEQVSDVLITTGGADPLHIAIQLLERFKTNRTFQKLRVHVVLGALNQDTDAITAIAQDNSWIRIHRNVTRMAELMCSCDLAISASGSTLYELCACGVPTVCYTFADNQIMLAEGFAKRGIMDYAGDFRMDTDAVIGQIIDTVCPLLTDSERRRLLSKGMVAVVDGKGAQRISEILLKEYEMIRIDAQT